MEVDMLLNMDGFDDNTTSVFYGADSWGTAFTTSPTSPFPPSASGSVAGNPTRSNLHSTDQTPSASDPSRSLISTRPLARSREDVPWQMYLSPSLSDSLYSLDLDILNHNSVDLVYPQDALTNFAELERLESPRSSGYQGTQTVNDAQQIFCTTPLVAPQPRIIQSALLSLISTQDIENSLLLAQGESSTKADDHTVSISDVGVLSAPQIDTYLAQSAPSSSLLSSSRGRDPTITKLVNHSSTSTRPRRGLSGWGNTNPLEPPAVPSSTSTMHQKPPSTSSSKSINSGLMVPDSLSPSLSSSTRGSSRNSERLLKRLRQPDEESLPILKQASKIRRIMVADVDTTEDDSVDNNGDDDGSDSDDYKPSRSPSLNPSRSISPSSHSFVFKSETGVASTSIKKKKPRKGKGKAKGSAALALAVVSQMVRNPSSAGRRDIDLTSTRHANGITRRKNQPIPLPIPVPNLNKKSRGRKVPHVVNSDTVMKRKSSSSSKALSIKKEEDVEEEEDGEEESGDDDEDQSRSSSTRSRKKPTTSEMSKTPSGENRTFVCVVPGCGKCFVRSEHLKRHVRSIHTYDKPHPCPFEGCDKSFSRRDNLGQHVRIHLQS